MNLTRAALCLTLIIVYQICALLWSQWTLSTHLAVLQVTPAHAHQALHVALVFDTNRAAYAAQVLRSLKYHNPGTQFVFHLVTDQQSRAKLQTWFRESSALRFYDHSLCDHLVAPVLAYSEPAIHTSAHCKAFLASIINADRVLYIDNDVTAVGDVSACYDHRFEDTQYIGMVVDMGDVCQYWPDRSASDMHEALCP